MTCAIQLYHGVYRSITNVVSVSISSPWPLSYLINFPLKLLTCYPKPKRQNMYPISDQKSKFNTLFLIRSAWTWHPQLIPNVCDLICPQLHILSGEMAEFCTHCIKIIHLLSDLLYNPGQNYVRHSCRMHCLDHRSFFTWKQTFLWAKFYLPLLPHAMLFKRKG